MPHDRLRKFNIRDWFAQGIDWDGAMVVRTEDEIYVSGQTGSELDGSRAHGTGHTAEDAAIQAEIALSNLAVLLAEAGATLDDICRINVNLSDRAYRIPVYRTIGRHLRGVHPVSTGLIVNGFARPEILFTLDVAVVPQRGAKHTRLRRYHSDDAKYGFERQKIGCDFCQVVRAGRRIYLQAMRNVEALLGEAGAGLSDIAKVILYVTDRAHLAPAREAVLRHLGAVPCVLSEIIVKGLASPDLAMEVDVFAVQA